MSHDKCLIVQAYSTLAGHALTWEREGGRVREGWRVVGEEGGGGGGGGSGTVPRNVFKC